ncbi:hypothetical protein INR49_012620 [Caranx melampygus]|nr:hypothetical protein INR49_012620 [Caranx melampygus]
MNADFQNPLQVPQPKVRSHLTIKVQSKLMSGPCPRVRGPKPPVAPKPRPLYESHPQGELCPPQRLSNGDLAHSDGESEDLHEMAEESQDQEQTHEANDNGTGDSDKEDTAEEESEKEADILVNDGDIDSIGSEETLKGDDGPAVDTTEDENTDNDLNQPEGGSHTDDETTSAPSVLLTEDEAGEEEEEEQQSASKKNEIPCDATGASEDQTESLNQGDKDSDVGLNEADSDHSEDCLQTELEAGGFAFGFTVLPTVTEEYPYDVIGPTDDASDTCESCDPTETGDTEVWQPERATKDLSGCFRFTSSTEDVFGPYSVIEAVPGDMTATADPEWSQDDTDDKASNELEIQGASNQDPFYVSSDDVDKLEDKQTLSDQEEPEEATEQSDQHKDKAKDGESADEYADIDESLCPKDGFEQLECVSSEDYVEIGDEDEEEETEKRHIKGKSAKERTAKREQIFHDQRKSCQPRLRLCNITVPADLDLGRTPELTNRVVFAHTTEAFEEDIEELDCHIVPYYEDTDSDSEEHIYEEAGLTQRGRTL